MKKLLAGLFLTLGLIACGESDKNNSPEDKPVIKIGVVYPMSGNAAFMGEGAKRATELFFKDYSNQNFKYKYELIWEDSQANPHRGVAAAKKLIDLDKVDIIVDCFANVAMTISPMAEDHKIVHLSFTQNEDISKGYYNYRIATSVEKTGKKMAQMLVKKHYNNIVGVVKLSEGPIFLFNGLEQAVKNNKNLKILEVYQINSGERNFVILIEKIKRLKPDAVVLALQYPEIDIFMKQAKMNNLEFPIVGLQGFPFLKDKSLAENSWYVDIAYANDHFVKKYTDFTGSAITNFAENFYTILQVIVNNYENIKTINGSKPSAETFIENLAIVNDLKTPIGILELDQKKQNIDSEASILIIKNQKSISMEP